MAETVIGIAATNPFSLSTDNFASQGGTQTPYKTFVPTLDANGNGEVYTEYDTGTNYADTLTYINATPAIVTDLATFLTTFGDVENGIEIDQIAIDFAAGVKASVNITGHVHDTDPHVDGTLQYADVSGVIPASSGVGVPTLITVAGDVSPVRATVTFSKTHVDQPGADGTHFTGENITFKCTISVDYVGQPSSVTAGSWKNIIQTDSDSNQTQLTSNVTAEQFFDAVSPA